MNRIIQFIFSEMCMKGSTPLYLYFLQKCTTRAISGDTFLSTYEKYDTYDSNVTHHNELCVINHTH